MKEIYSLSKKLQEYLVDERHSITTNPRFDGCSCKGLIEGSLYMYIPHIGAEHYESKAQKIKENRIKESQEQVKEQIKSYAKENNLEIAVSKTKFCGSFECTGHYVDPFKEKADGEHVIIKDFPKDINGAYVYFLKPENMEIMELMQSRI